MPGNVVCGFNQRVQPVRDILILTLDRQLLRLQTLALCDQHLLLRASLGRMLQIIIHTLISCVCVQPFMIRLRQARLSLGNDSGTLYLIAMVAAVLVCWGLHGARTDSRREDLIPNPSFRIDLFLPDAVKRFCSPLCGLRRHGAPYGPDTGAWPLCSALCLVALRSGMPWAGPAR